MATISSTADNYNYEKNRLKSFQLWPCPNIVNPNELAKGGFYSTGFYMETQCNWCHTSISDWQPNDQVMERHMDAHPFCQFIANPNGCGNIPLESDRNSEMRNNANRENENGSSSSHTSNINSNMTTSAASNNDNTSTNNIVSGNSDNSSGSGSSSSSNGESGPTNNGEQRQLLPRQQSQQQNVDFTQLDLKIELHRLATFKNWPNPNISPQSLAKAGFYYFNKSDHVKCAWCKGIIAKWEKGDNAFQEHDRFFPDCPRVQLGPLIEITSENCTLDGELGIQQICPPKSTKYSCLDARMRTYSRWPIPDIQNPEILAQAGFYYQEIEDQVRCFHCHGGLRSWQKEDDPWFEHAKWFPYCNFLKLVKGPNFVSQIRSAGRQQQQPSQMVDGRNCSGGNSSSSGLNENGSITNHQEQQSRQTTVASEPSMNIDEAMQTEPVQRALEMGLNAGRIINATRRQLESHGKPFDTTEELVEAVLEGQVDEEDDADGPEPSSSIVREVSRILNNIFNPRHQSTTTAETGDYDFDDIADFHGPGEGSSSIISSLNQNENMNRLNGRSIIDSSIGTSSNMNPNSEISSSTVSCNHNITTTNNEISSNSNCSNTSNLLNRDNSNSTLNESQQQQESNVEDNNTSLSNDVKSDQSKIRPKLNEQQSLEEENRKLKDARTCKVCMDDEVGVVFLPCGHLVTCVQCAPGVTVCPLCRSAIKGFVRTFLS